MVLTPINCPLIEKEGFRYPDSLTPAQDRQQAGSDAQSLGHISQYPLILPPKGLTPRKKLERYFDESGLTYRVIMESSNIELSAVYVEMGLGISFATIVSDLPAFAQRDFRFISLGHYFDANYLSLVFRKDKANKSFLKAFIDIALYDPDCRHGDDSFACLEK